MPKFDSLLKATTTPTDVVAFVQTLVEVRVDSPIAVVMDGTKIKSLEIEGITQPDFDSVMTKVQAQFPAAF